MTHTSSGRDNPTQRPTRFPTTTLAALPSRVTLPARLEGRTLNDDDATRAPITIAVGSKGSGKSAAAQEAEAGDGRSMAELCTDLLELLRGTCGRELNADGTLWCARQRGHADECKPLPSGVWLPW